MGETMKANSRGGPEYSDERRASSSAVLRGRCER